LLIELLVLASTTTHTHTNTQRIEARLNFQTVLDPDVLTSQLSALTSLQSLDMYTSYFDENVLLSDAPLPPTATNSKTDTAYTAAAEGTGAHYSG
jgi:hypothetical protein